MNDVRHVLCLFARLLRLVSVCQRLALQVRVIELEVSFVGQTNGHDRVSSIFTHTHTPVILVHCIFFLCLFETDQKRETQD